MQSHKFSVVSEQEAKIVPYPYVMVEDDGSYHELTEEQKEHLEYKFSGGDGARPYVKSRFYSKTPDGKLGGYLKRSKLPRSLKKGEVPRPRMWWQLW